VRLRPPPPSDGLERAPSSARRCFRAMGMLGEALPDACVDGGGWLTLGGVGAAPVYLSLRPAGPPGPAGEAGEA
jgi:hypothetical protein